METLNAVADPAAGKGEGGEKHEIYAAAIGGHLFYDLFSQSKGEGGMAPYIRYWNDPVFLVSRGALISSSDYGRHF